jgi:hypothetical protein
MHLLSRHKSAHTAELTNFIAVLLCIHICELCRCLLSKAYNAAAPLLELELTEVDPARTAVGATDLLLYCYYGGMVATGAALLLLLVLLLWL